ncbi:MAG TPA: histidine phosphatase family protein [Pyrinomonadaceae bacterium]|jgi:phosphohistidine phosphatase
MKTLYILRHAKSCWDNPNLADFDRSLNERGLESAPLIGAIIGKNKFQPDLMLSSPAQRAKQTAELVKEAGKIDAEIQFDERIYEASPQQLLQIISEIKTDTESAMLVGHNPGLEGIIRFLTGENQPMPTAALAVVDLQVQNWEETIAECGNLRTLIRPNE